MNANEVMNKLAKAANSTDEARAKVMKEQLEIVREFAEYVRESTTKRDILTKLAEELTRIAAELDGANKIGNVSDQDARASMSEHWTMTYYNTLAAAAMVTDLRDEWAKQAEYDVNGEESVIKEALRKLKECE